jgi:hypothetical protein
MGIGRLVAGGAIPMLKLPETVPRPAVAVGAMLVLAGLDVAGALLAKRWATGGSVLWFGAGVGCFIVLFWVYGSSLRYAELVPVTFGWIVALQVSLMLLDSIRSPHPVPMGRWIAAVGIIALEGYLLFSAGSD